MAGFDAFAVAFRHGASLRNLNKFNPRAAVYTRLRRRASDGILLI
jgi:hypothetical protein